MRFKSVKRIKPAKLSRPVDQTGADEQLETPKPAEPAKSVRTVKIKRFGSGLSRKWESASRWLSNAWWEVSRRTPTDVVRVVIVLVVLGGAVLYGVDWAESDESCTSCHDMGVESAIPHEDVSCVSCHRAPGVIGWARHGISYARMTIDSMALSKDPASGMGGLIDEAACVGCHAKVFRDEYDKGRRVKIAHRHLLQKGVACGRCHQLPGHSNKGAPLAQRPAMSECLRCHDDRVAKSECKTCHTSKPSDGAASRRAIDPIKVVGDGSCRGCHPTRMAQRCIKCHGGYEMPHPPGWTEGGHFYYAFVDKEDCWNCHESYDSKRAAGSHKGGARKPGGGFCEECHEFPSPHGPSSTWLRTHGTAAKGTPLLQPGCPCHGNPPPVDKCDYCHQQGTCDTCHAMSKRLKKEGFVP